MVVIRVQNTHCHLSKNTGWDPPVSSFLNLQRPHLHHGRAAPPVTCAPRRFPFLHKCAINAPASPPLFPLPETAAPRLHRAPPALMVVARASPSTASVAPPPLPPPPYKRCARPPAPPTPPLALSSPRSIAVVVWTSLGPIPQWVPGPTTRRAPGTTRLALHGTCWRAQGLRRRSTRIGSCTCPTLYRGLLDVLD
jgi:hypothetical protein